MGNWLCCTKQKTQKSWCSLPTYLSPFPHIIRDTCLSYRQRTIVLFPQTGPKNPDSCFPISSSGYSPIQTTLSSYLHQPTSLPWSRSSSCQTSPLKPFGSHLLSGECPFLLTLLKLLLCLQCHLAISVYYVSIWIFFLLSELFRPE